MIISKNIRVKQTKTKPKYKYAFNSQIYDLNVRTSFEQKLGVKKAKQPSLTLPQKIKSNASFSVERTSDIFTDGPNKETFTNVKKMEKNYKVKNNFKLPQIRRTIIPHNPEEQIKFKKVPQPYYQSKLFKSLKTKQNTYTMNLLRQHFLQNVQAIRIGKNIKLDLPKEIKLSKKIPKFKTIFLDLDQTLIHCDQSSTNYTMKLNFPIEGGGTISAGIRVRPFCHQFIKQLSSFAQLIIFTASAASYADVVLDYLDPQKKYFAHRLYRQHCTIEKGFYMKDLRIVNRRLQDMAIVDNSAFSYMTQPEFGIPILPFYHYAKDNQLKSLLEYLKKLVQQDDMRENIKKTFFWQNFKKNDADPRKIFRMQYQNQQDLTI